MNMASAARCVQNAWLRGVCLAAALAALTGLASARAARACPFCKAERPTLAQRCEAAEEALLAECLEAGQDSCELRLLKALRSSQERKTAEAFSLPAAQVQPALQAEGKLAAGSLVLLLALPAAGESSPPRWEYLPLDEVAYAYLARLPARVADPAERLAYFTPYLEHASRLLAEDAYLEFAHAPYDVVAKAAAHVDAERLRAWIQSPDVPDERKGLYGLMLGLAASERDRIRNARRLRELIEQPALDLRAGFDGVLAGYLLLEGEDGLELLQRRILGNPEAAEGDVRHAVAALRFHQVHAQRISHERLGQALALLLDRPGFAAEIISDLARLRYWDALRSVVACFAPDTAYDPAVDRAVIGYLLACPLEEARASLALLRQQHPRRVAEAEAVLRRLQPLGPN